MSVLSNGGHTGLREKSSDTILSTREQYQPLTQIYMTAHISGLVGEL
jgi:hypothetical protein